MNMDGTTFSVDMIKALAWPLTTIVLAFLLREPLKALIPLITRLKYKDFELEFDRKVEELRNKAADELPIKTTEYVAPALPAPMAKLVIASPRAAIIEAWRLVELAVVKRARRLIHGRGDEPTKVSFHEALRELENDAKIGPSVQFLAPLRRLRNQAAHAPEFALSSESAADYAATACHFVRTLED
ncbi:MAG: hypothetical protein WC881_04630 [Elusimicrobiota bacterium]|jgi:hypothetical protein